MSAVSVYPSGIFFYFEDTVNPLLSPPRAYLFQSLLKGGLMEMGGGGGGGGVVGGGGA